MIYEHKPSLQADVRGAGLGGAALYKIRRNNNLSNVVNSFFQSLWFSFHFCIETKIMEASSPRLSGITAKGVGVEF